MTPAATRLLARLKRPKKITMRPAVLKKTPDLAYFPILNELKLRSASTGSVPSANESMVRAPVAKLPVVSV